MSERRRISALVASAALVLAACGGGNGESAEPEAEQQTEAPAADIVITGTASFDFEPSQVEAEAGTISVFMTTEGGPHTFTVELDEGAETVVQVFGGGEPATGEIELEAGTYTFFCAIPGHREAGMVGTLTVS